MDHHIPHWSRDDHLCSLDPGYMGRTGCLECDIVRLHFLSDYFRILSEKASYLSPKDEHANEDRNIKKIVSFSK